MIKEAGKNNTDMLIVDDTREAAVHAIRNKYITAKHYNAIVKEIKKNEVIRILNNGINK